MAFGVCPGAGDSPASPSGAFSARVTLDDVARITADQVAELARFVHQYNPDVLRQVLSMLA